MLLFVKSVCACVRVCACVFMRGRVCACMRVVWICFPTNLLIVA